MSLREGLGEWGARPVPVGQEDQGETAGTARSTVAVEGRARLALRAMMVPKGRPVPPAVADLFRPASGRSHSN